ncbi:tRNA pseudouridine(38-40) synthase TruA [Oribacterium sp. WCC10]|uniref:tRNA pseudouridine(38-40) synthase TruA n=1 Tax=Oribacterium sp. WCC10 TaxID=1855343 RepID=UPI0008E4354C|nr:tRNA pseudouridine(38-40) synthase TruA [Oribacterium sp. WCC10]SFG35907.1 tRNA pseudouridine38-40 synthase [Oribacterium sp. WCC10]
MKRRIKLTIAYDGSNYKGWQIQNPTKEMPEGNVPTIQGMLTLAIKKLLKDEDVQIIGASRTDSGVHAKGNVAVFDTESTIPPENFPFAINSFLPEDIRVTKAEDVSLDFNPRFVPHKKTYEYRIDNSRIPSPIERLYSYNYSYTLDIMKMQKAADYLVGEHDFRSFVNPDSQVFEHGGDAVREIYSVEVLCENTVYNRISDRLEGEAGSGNDKSGDKHHNSTEICIRISGNGFLYHMIRIIVGTLLQVGNGKLNPEDIVTIMEERDRTKAGPTVPAKGLCLMELIYPEN